jgi:hypothetical protein
VGDEDDEALSASTVTSGVRWRLQAVVPSADLQDLLPVAQLLSSRTASQRSYEAAKSAFLETVGGWADGGWVGGWPRRAPFWRRWVAVVPLSQPAT